MMRSITNPTFLCVIYILFFSIDLSGQDYSTYLKIKESYKGESVVKLENRKTYTIDIVKGQLEVYEEVNEKYIFLMNNRGEAFDLRVFTSEFFELVDFEANSYILENQKYRKIPVKNYTEKINAGNNYFYDDTKELKFIFPGIAAGTVVEFNHRLKVHDPRMLRTIFLDWFYPIHNMEISFIYDKNIDLDLLHMHTGSGRYKIIESTRGNKRLYTLSGTRVDGLIPEGMTPDVRYFIPHIIPVIRQYTYKNRIQNVLADTDALYAWYYSFIDGLNKDIGTKELKSLADSIVQDCKTDLCKVEQLYYWVQKNIKYIAFEYGMGGFIPRKADLVLKNKYGDCKDNTSLLHELAKQVGIPTYFTWIGTQDIPYTYSEVSSPVADNHMILTYIGPDSVFYFLDATSRYNNIGNPTSFIQGKEALIGLDSTNYIINQVPVVGCSKNKYIDSVYVTLDNMTLSGKGDMVLTGYQYVESMYNLNDSDEENIRDYLKLLLKKGNNKFQLQDYTLPDVCNIDTITHLPYTFNLPSYVQDAGEELFVNLNLNKEILTLKVDKDRKYPIAFDHHRFLENKFVLEVPDGYKVDLIPQDDFFDHEDFGFSIKYEQSGNKIIYDHIFYIKTNLIYPNKFNSWRELIQRLEKAYKQTIVLKQDSDNWKK